MSDNSFILYSYSCDGVLHVCVFFFLLKRQPVGGLCMKQQKRNVKRTEMKEAHRKRKKKIVLFTHFTCSYFNSSSCLFYIMFIRLSFYSILKKWGWEEIFLELGVWSITFPRSINKPSDLEALLKIKKNRTKERHIAMPFKMINTKMFIAIVSAPILFSYNWNWYL
jgi:hypothetical protein